MTGARRVRLKDGDTVREVVAAPDGSLSVAGASGPVTVRPIDGVAFDVRVRERRVRVYAVAAGSHWWAFADGCTFHFEVAAAAANAADASEPAGGEMVLAAPMPGTVAAVHAAPGQTVQRDDTLVVLEAMKMELAVRAPHDGVVKSTCCRPGELVQQGAPLVRLLPPAPGDRP